MAIKLCELQGRRYDAVVIGLGINGAAALRELACAGYSVLGVDMHDFGSGASARSSRLLHCGLRYLAPGRSLWEFVWRPQQFATALRMARQAVTARNEFVHAEPHRVSAIKVHFPIYEGGPYATWQVRAAFGLLGAMNAHGIPLDYSMLSHDEAVRAPMLRMLRSRDQLKAVVSYREYSLIWPERICVDAVLDAEAAGAAMLNYTRVQSCAKTPQGDWRIHLEGNVEIRTPVVLNMAGIWIDDIVHTANLRAPRRVVGTKGAHILVRMPEECRSLGIASLNSKGEPFYCLPWGDYHYFGPTETLYEGDKERVFVNTTEMEFLLSEANRLFPSQALNASHIVQTWAGVRPLTFDSDLPMGKRNRLLHDLSRDDLAGMLALTGGPLTSHRSAGREVRQALDRLTGKIGDKREKIRWEHAAIDRDLLQKLCANEPRANEQLQRVLSNEQVRTLSDLFFRRLGVAWFERIEPAKVRQIASVVAAMLNWNEAKTEMEIAKFLDELNTIFGYGVSKQAEEPELRH
ncbi:FAD-dependent oxidoreductase [Bradyrhizobium sp. DASA03076]|uniref:FAD-dependent oxidoreductase n=1 Tax=Bradyrhizobium sp. BLXBL-03 TaxID=3395916 RepID=UPI003F7233A2